MTAIEASKRQRCLHSNAWTHYIAQLYIAIVPQVYSFSIQAQCWSIQKGLNYSPNTFLHLDLCTVIQWMYTVGVITQEAAYIWFMSFNQCNIIPLSRGSGYVCLLWFWGFFFFFLWFLEMFCQMLLLSVRNKKIFGEKRKSNIIVERWKWRMFEGCFNCLCQWGPFVFWIRN